MGEQNEKRSSLGFTIIEIMIVLAVMGAMFLGAALLVAGRQNETEFTQAVEQIQSQIQQVSDDVINGYYPSLGSFTCNISQPLGFTSNSGTDTQGTHNGCIFLGKVMQFNPSSTSSNQPVYVYSIAGTQCDSTGTCDVGQSDLSSSLSNASPTVVMGQGVDATQIETLENGMNATNMYYKGSDGVAHTSYAVGFLQSLASYSDTTGNSLLSGAQQVGLWAISGVTDKQTEADAVSNINEEGNWTPVDEVDICFTSGTTNQSGLVTIGGSGRQLSVVLKIYSDRTCGA